jgi:flagellar motor component MotA
MLMGIGLGANFKTTLLASMQGYNPATAIEFGRKVLYSQQIGQASPSWKPL